MSVAWQSSAWIDVSEEADCVVLRVCGELDTSSCSAIETALSAAVASCPFVVLDLSALTFCDSSGIATFLRTAGRAAAAGSSIEVRGSLPPVLRVFEIAGVDQVLHITAG